MRVTLRSRRLLAAGAALPLLIGGLSLVTAGPASADLLCTPGVGYSDQDGNTGHGVAYPVTIRSGPEKDCTPWYYFDDTVQLNYDCYYTNANGVDWTHLHPAGYPQYAGWVINSNLNDGGSRVRC